MIIMDTRKSRYEEKQVRLHKIINKMILKKERKIREEWCPQFLLLTGGCGVVRLYTVM